MFNDFFSAETKWRRVDRVQNNNWNQTPNPYDRLRSLMMDKCAIAVSKGGLEMEEKLKTAYCGLNAPPCSFLWSSNPGHQLYKDKVAEYTKSPPPTPPAQLDQFNSLEELPDVDLGSDVFTVEIPQGMMRKELGIIKLVAQFEARYGFRFSMALWNRVYTEAQFQFLDRRNRSDTRHRFFTYLVYGYGNIIQTWEYHPLDDVVEGFFPAFEAFKRKQEEEEQDEVVGKVFTDRSDFLVIDEYFVEIESKEWPPLRPGHGLCLDPYRFRVGIPDGVITRKEFGIIDLTAQFVVRYGNEFCDALWDRVCSETEFQFLNRNPGNDRSKLFSQLLPVYANIIMEWDKQPRKSNRARMNAVLEGFLKAFAAFKETQEEEDDVLVDKTMTDRKDFMIRDSYFVEIELTPPEMPMHPGSFYPPSSMRAGSSRLPDEPEPKRVKFEESDLVPEEEFLARYPGSATITILATTGRLLQIRVESLSESVGSLKEKIAVEMGIPANQQKLIVKAGFLKDNMSLAHYNLRTFAGEMPTLAF